MIPEPAIIIHNFQERLEWSASLSDEPAWVDFYRRLWPNMLAAIRVDSNCKWQRWGVDRMILLPDGKQILVDEKKRSGDYADVLLEEWSICRYDPAARRVMSGEKVGWALDDTKHCDYVAYAVPTRGTCYMLPFELLRATCAHNLPVWKQNPSYYPKAARNDTYWTVNVAVPWSELKRALCAEMLRRFGSTLELPTGIRIGNQFVFDFSANTTDNAV